MQTSIFRYFSFILALIVCTVPVSAKEKRLHKYSEIKCGKAAMERSSCMIRTILDDIKNNYTFFDNGGVSEIKGISTYSYRISIPRNEAVDVITYAFELQKSGNLRILTKTESTDSYK